MRARQVVACLALALLALGLAPGSAGAAPTLTITPGSGPRATAFVATLSDFTPGEAIALQLATDGTPARTLDIPVVKINAEGRYLLTITAALLEPGAYTLTALRGTTSVASARFTVTGAAAATPTARATPTSGTGTTRTPTPAAPSPPPTGSGGFLPGLPATGSGGAGDLAGRGGLLVAAGASAIFGLAMLRTRQARQRRRPAAIVADTRNDRRKGGA